MILSAKSILKEIKAGNIVIDPFDEKQLNPNSYNLRLANEIMTYDNGVLDMKWNNPYTISTFDDIRGRLLIPGKIYLARSVEKTFTKNLVPMIEGRSSIGRLGLFIHTTAGFGDNGFNGYWTFELSCIEPITIYPNVEIAQIYFHTIQEVNEDGNGHEVNPMLYTNGKYQNNYGVQPSMLWKEFCND